MRVQVHGWFRSFTLVAWDGDTNQERSVPSELELAELRALLVSEPGFGVTLRRFLYALEALAPHEQLEDVELCRRTTQLVTRGLLRLEIHARDLVLTDPSERGVEAEWDSEHSGIRDNRTHWIEIELVDADDQPIVHEPCLIVLPDGRERSERTSELGLIYIDRILAGQCQVRFPERDGVVAGPLELPPRKEPGPVAFHWVELELLDDSGTPMVGERCEITLPNGECVESLTDVAGLVRVARFVGEGPCSVRFPDLDGIERSVS